MTNNCCLLILLLLLFYCTIVTIFSGFLFLSFQKLLKPRLVSQALEEWRKKRIFSKAKFSWHRFECRLNWLPVVFNYNYLIIQRWVVIFFAIFEAIVKKTFSLESCNPGGPKHLFFKVILKRHSFGKVIPLAVAFLFNILK